jgi:hypothetical protein
MELGRCQVPSFKETRVNKELEVYKFILIQSTNFVTIYYGSNIYIYIYLYMYLTVMNINMLELNYPYVHTHMLAQTHLHTICLA